MTHVIDTLVYIRLCLPNYEETVFHMGQTRVVAPATEVSHVSGTLMVGAATRAEPLFARTNTGDAGEGRPGWRPGELFEGLTAEQFSCARTCLHAQIVHASRHDRVVSHDPRHPVAGVLIEGTALDVRFRGDGSSSLVDVIEPGGLFGDGWDDLDDGIDRAVVAVSSCRAIVLDSSRLVEGYSACAVRPLLVDNFLRAMMRKQARLREHFDLVTRRSLRERLTMFLLGEAQRFGRRQFTIPLSRAELSEFLHADRTAVSRELARMRDESLIDFHRNSFTVRTLH